MQVKLMYTQSPYLNDQNICNNQFYLKKIRVLAIPHQGRSSTSNLDRRKWLEMRTPLSFPSSPPCEGNPCLQAHPEQGHPSSGELNQISLGKSDLSCTARAVNESSHSEGSCFTLRQIRWSRESFWPLNWGKKKRKKQGMKQRYKETNRKSFQEQESASSSLPKCSQCSDLWRKSSQGTGTGTQESFTRTSLCSAVSQSHTPASGILWWVTGALYQSQFSLGATSSFHLSTGKLWSNYSL